MNKPLKKLASLSSLSGSKVPVRQYELASLILAASQGGLTEIDIVCIVLSARAVVRVTLALSDIYILGALAHVVIGVNRHIRCSMSLCQGVVG